MLSLYYGAHTWNPRIGFYLQHFCVPTVSVWVTCRFSGFSLAMSLLQMQMHATHNSILYTRGCTHTAFDTSITQPVESEGCTPFAAGSKSLLQWREQCTSPVVISWHFMAESCCMSSDVHVQMVWIVVRPQQHETPTECRMRIEWRDLILVSLQLLSWAL